MPMQALHISALALLLWSLPGAAFGASPRRLYTQGHKAYHKGQWEAARRSFESLLPLLEARQKRQAKGSKAFHLLTIGRCDVLFHLASIRWKQKQLHASCRLHQELSKLLGQLPSQWRGWRLHPDVPRRLQASSRHLSSRCAKLPTPITLHSRLPPQSTVELRTGKGWMRVPSFPFSTHQSVLSLRIQAPGYQTRILRRVKLRRWQLNALRIQLKRARAPAPRKLAKQRRLPMTKRPAALPFYKTWWFWTLAAGAVVAGGAAVAIVALQDARTVQLQTTNQGGFPIF